MFRLRLQIATFLLIGFSFRLAFGADQSTHKPRARVLVIGVNGMEWDIVRPLLLKGELPNLAKVISNGVHGKLKTTSAPNVRGFTAPSSPVRTQKSTA